MIPRYPLDSVGFCFEKLVNPFWEVSKERAVHPTMEQWSVWIDIGHWSLHLFVRWEDRK